MISCLKSNACWGNPTLSEQVLFFKREYPFNSIQLYFLGSKKNLAKVELITYNK